MHYASAMVNDFKGEIGREIVTGRRPLVTPVARNLMIQLSKIKYTYAIANGANLLFVSRLYFTPLSPTETSFA